MGFFGSSNPKVRPRDFDKTLKSVPDLTRRERDYVRGVFQKPLKDGLTRKELDTEIRGLRRNKGDRLSSSEVKRIQDKLGDSMK